MREALQDILRQSGNLFTTLKITGTDSSTQINAVDDDKTLIFAGQLKQPIKEFNGIFGIRNLSLLSGLLNFASYKTEAATFTAKRRVMGDVETVEEFNFSDGSRTGAVFRLTAPALIPEIIELSKPPPWDADFIPDKAKIAEFATLSGLYSSVEPTFVPRIAENDLQFLVGNENSSTHRASIVFHDGEGITGKITGDLRYSLSQFLSVLKLAGTNPVRVAISGRGIMRINVDTQFGAYDYYLRSSRA
jgi:hypothetical protein